MKDAGEAERKNALGDGRELGEERHLGVLGDLIGNLYLGGERIVAVPLLRQRQIVLGHFVLELNIRCRRARVHVVHRVHLYLAVLVRLRRRVELDEAEVCAQSMLLTLAHSS